MSNVADYSHGEPPPVANDGPSMHDLVIHDLILIISRKGEINNPTMNSFISLMTERKRFGLEKYNTVLQAFNGRNPLNDLVDELLDALVYAKQDIVEQEKNNSEPAGLIHAKTHYNRLLTLSKDIIRERLRRARLA
jgi:hypothetical protein